MELTITKKTFTELRRMVKLLHESVNNGYLTDNWKDEKDSEYEDIIMTDAGYYAHIDDCTEIDGQFYHLEKDEDEIVMDEIDNEYILMSESVYVLTGRGNGFHTHENNCTASNDIYEYDCEYITQSYMERNDLVFDVHGYIHHIEDVYFWESDGEYHDEPEEDEDEGDNTNLIHSYSYKPNSQFFSLPYDNENVPFFGIELEIEKKNDESMKMGELCDMIQNKHWYFKKDGSLNNGFEIVTHPLSFNYIKQTETKFSESLKFMVDNGYNSYNSTTCGMHIHISKKAFSTWQLYRFMKFFVENKDFILAISQRKIDKLNRWASIEDDNNEGLIYKAKKKNGNAGRYVAINLQNYATIEVRIFRGTLNPQSFMKNIEFTHSLFMYTKEHNEITLAGYKNYIENSCDYSNLKKFIKLKNL